jgi:signal transduction histidine kinase
VNQPTNPSNLSNPSNPSRQRKLLLATEWGLLFLVLLGTIWAATQSEDAPELILLGLLTVITLNFSLPPERGAAGLTPVVVMSSFLMMGLETAVLLLIASIILAELARPLWNPLWELVDIPRPGWRERLGLAVVHVLTLISAALVFERLGGVAPLDATHIETFNLNLFTLLALAYGAAYFGLMWLLWRLLGHPWAQFFRANALTVVIYGFLAQPFAWLGSITFVRDGLPTFVIFALGVSLFSVVVWLSWQRRYVMEQRLAQFAALNRTGASLRETLDLPTVLARTGELAQELAPADRFTITLKDARGQWTRPFTTPTPAAHNDTLDDFTRWVAENGRILDLDHRNIPFAARHNLTPPQPIPAAWLGIPLTSGEQVNGVMVWQRYPPHPPFNQWNREVLRTIAGQASAAIQNARLHAETVRLYNLTDEALALRVKQLQALLDSIQEGVLMVDSNGRVVLLNPIATALLERPTSDLYQRPLDPATTAAPLGFSPEELAELLRQVQSGLLPPARHCPFAAGQRFYVRLEAPVRATDGLPLGWLMLFRDVTEERHLAERRTDLTRMIVHDLRNPLTTLVSTIGLLEDQLLPARPESQELLETARHGCLDMLDMVDSLMDVNRMEAGQSVVDAEAMRLPPLVERIVRRLAPLAQQRGISLSFAPPPPDLPPVWADEEMIRRVLLNVLDNALKFTPRGGEVNGRLQTNPTASGEPGVRCIIRDTGPGIPPDLREHVFDRYVRTSQEGAPVRGTGLGLTFCKVAIEAHNGRIWFEDAPEGGSQFVFTLPGIPDFDMP